MSDFDIGKQGRLDLIVNGAVQESAQLTEFQPKQETITVTSRTLGSPKREKYLPDGWSGTAKYDRLGPMLDDLFAQAEDDYWSAGLDMDVVITQTVKEKDGSISQYRYEDVAVKLEDAGSYSQDKTVSQTIMWTASRRRKVV